MLGRPVERTNTVMLVGGDPDLTQVYGKGLTRSGLFVSTASSGERALLQIGKAVPDLIVTGMQLPGMDGLQLLEALRSSEDPEVRSLPTVMLASLPDEGVRARSRELGALDFLLQPETSAPKLARQVGQLLGAPGRLRKARVIKTGRTTWQILASR
jgi:CheY-like chemotaxis protein